MGFSQKILAEKCKAAHSYIRQIESGTGHPSFAFIEKLANALNIEPYKLFIEESSLPASDPISQDLISQIKIKFLNGVADKFQIAIEEIINKTLTDK